MSRVVKCSACPAVTPVDRIEGSLLRSSCLRNFLELVEKPRLGPRWLHEIKLDGHRRAARIANGCAQLLTRTRLDRTDEYRSAVTALTNLNMKTAYIDGELCGGRRRRIAELCSNSGRDRARTEARRTGLRQLPNSLSR